MHWSEFIGGDVVISPPYAWQVRYNASDIPVVPRIDNPVDPKIVAELSNKFVDFRRAYTEDGLSLETFDSFGRLGSQTIRCRLRGSRGHHPGFHAAGMIGASRMTNGQ